MYYTKSIIFYTAYARRLCFNIFKPAIVCVHINYLFKKKKKDFIAGEICFYLTLFF